MKNGVAFAAPFFVAEYYAQKKLPGRAAFNNFVAINPF